MDSTRQGWSACPNEARSIHALRFYAEMIRYHVRHLQDRGTITPLLGVIAPRIGSELRDPMPIKKDSVLAR